MDTSPPKIINKIYYYEVPDVAAEEAYMAVPALPADVA